MSLDSLNNALKRLQDPQRAKTLARFFKTGPGEYAQGDQFLGITVPSLRQLVTTYHSQLNYQDIALLLKSPYHESRLLALLTLVKKYHTSKTESAKKKIYDLYLANRQYINNWDLVDVTTPQLMGDYLLTHSREIIYQLVQSDNVWERRISIMATFAFIKVGEFEDTLKLSKILLRDSHDLIHKAVGWMLREVGKRDKNILLNYLDQHATVMPRTMLRYAIEKLSPTERQYYLNK